MRQSNGTLCEHARNWPYKLARIPFSSFLHRHHLKRPAAHPRSRPFSPDETGKNKQQLQSASIRSLEPQAQASMPGGRVGHRAAEHAARPPRRQKLHGPPALSAATSASESGRVSKAFKSASSAWLAEWAESRLVSDALCSLSLSWKHSSSLSALGSVEHHGKEAKIAIPGCRPYVTWHPSATSRDCRRSCIAACQDSW